MASVWQAPVVFIVTNNLYGEYSAVRATTPIDDLAERAAPHRIPAAIVDGQDVDAVYAATCEAVTRARSGEGPTLLEMKTYRYVGHSRSDPAKYRVPGELERWKARDPIELLGGRLEAEQLLGADERVQIESETRVALDEAASVAQSAPYPTMEDIARYVYAD
jgi:pyruvate dehydrogenase E1 component alpha subunit